MLVALKDLSICQGLYVLAALISTHYIARLIYNLYLHPLAKIPGPPTWCASRLPFVVSLIRGTIVHDFEKLHRKYGPILRVAPDEITFAQPEAWNDIFLPRQDHKPFLKDRLWWSRQPGQPDNLVSAIDPENHARIRKALSAGFTPRALRSQEPIIQRYVNLLVERLRDQILASGEKKTAEVDIGQWFHFTTFDIFGDLGFGESFDCLETSKFHPWIALLFNSVKAASFVVAARYYAWLEIILIHGIPASVKKKAAKHYNQIADKVQRRLNWELSRPDLMSYVIQKGPDSQTVLPLGEINATFMVLTTAGSETTATALSGTVNYLVNNTATLDILVKEVRSKFASDADISLDGLRDLPYLNAVLQEGLRLCPPVPWILPRRVSDGGSTVCGVWLPGGTPVSIQAYTMNRCEDYFHSATSFHPERWLEHARSDPSSLYFRDRREALQPFSIGPRNCLGQHLAWAEMRLILAKLVWNFDIEVVAGRKIRWEDLRTFLLVEKKPIMMKLGQREDL
ncbi:cytochrome P450 [Rhypophila decipiens]|uniref:Cytochrome P450 n=1 Tax=Rhypophila decipiens TaxID=261697 RepID=A0AAN6YD59_9PEZI|nr:cytochrome P450 [Rhypophila decipiens]